MRSIGENLPLRGAQNHCPNDFARGVLGSKPQKHPSDLVQALDLSPFEGRIFFLRIPEFDSGSVRNIVLS